MILYAHIQVLYLYMVYVYILILHILYFSHYIITCIYTTLYYSNVSTCNLICLSLSESAWLLYMPLFICLNIEYHIVYNNSNSKRYRYKYNNKYTRHSYVYMYNKVALIVAVRVIMYVYTI